MRDYTMLFRERAPGTPSPGVHLAVLEQWREGTLLAASARSIADFPERAVLRQMADAGFDFLNWFWREQVPRGSLASIAEAHLPDWMEAHHEVDWCALDAGGRVGVFAAGGVGFVPREYAIDRALIEEMGAWVESLPRFGQAVAPSGTSRAWLEMAEKGLYVFDGDATGEPLGSHRGYRREASPTVPADAPDALARRLIRFSGCVFAQEDVLGARRLMEHPSG